MESTRWSELEPFKITFVTRRRMGEANDEMELKTGTTIFACRFKDGVVLGSDTRMTMGPYVHNRACEKVVPLYDNVYICRCGSAADCQTIADYVKFYVDQHAIAIGEVPTVKSVANLVKLIIYQNKHLMGGMIVAGWDAEHGGQVYGITIGGTLVSENWLIDGSGSTYIWGVCDSLYKDTMEQHEAQEFAIVALSGAMTRDSGSGGMARLVTVTATGAQRTLVEAKDLPVYPGDLPMPVADAEMVDESY